MVSCYNTNGRENRWDGKDHAPCNATAVELGGHSTCCHIGDLCLTNGMCLQKEDSGKKNWYWRTGCTDKDWKDPACPKYCGNIEPSRNTGLIFQCTDKDSWCCGYVGGRLQDWPSQADINRTCCTVDDLKFTAEDPVVYATARLYVGTTSLEPISTHLSTVSQPTTGATQTGTERLSDLPTEVSTAAPTVAPSQEASPSGLTTGAKVAIGLGVSIPVSVVVLAAIGAFSWWRHRKRSKGTTNVSELYTPHADNKGSIPPYHETVMNQQGAAVYRHEAPSPHVVAELPGSAEPQELPQQTKPGQ